LVTGFASQCRRRHGIGDTPAKPASLRDHVPMSRRPDESAASWYERAIDPSSVAATHQESLASRTYDNPAAANAIVQRANAAAEDLKLAAAAFSAAR
jgi:hypothetical protein